MNTYPIELTNRDPDWLRFNADLESGWLEAEPHQIVSHDFAAGVADEPKELRHDTI